MTHSNDTDALSTNSVDDLVGIFDGDALDEALAKKTSPIKAFRDALRQTNQGLRQRFEQGVSSLQLVIWRARLIDEVLERMWCRCGLSDDSDIALIAVGGYGRGELHLHSDIDLLLLLEQDNHDRYRGRIESFITSLWDIGLEVGHSVRSLRECLIEARQDITVATNLMEARRLTGPPALLEQMQQQCACGEVWPSRAFLEGKLAEQVARHRKYHDTAYNLEPNIKEGPGGLRDIQMVGWVAKRHFGVTSLHGLVDVGFLTEAEYHTLMEAQAFLWEIRWALHTFTGRREDRLLFDHQRTLAQHYGYHDAPHGLAVEQFMKRYYRTVMDLSRLNEMLIQLFQETVLMAEQPVQVHTINRRFRSRNGFLELANDQVLQRYPFALLELFLLMAQHPELQGVRASTIRRIRDQRNLIDKRFRSDLRNRSLFLELLKQPQGVYHELRRMNRYGVLAAYIPAFGGVVGQMQHDLFHVYTVDEHTLFVVRNLRRYFVAAHGHELPLCTRVAQQLPKPHLLYLAGLFHDIAKGRGGDHSQLGAQEAQNFCQLHGLPLFDGRLVAWLVEKHLIMSATAQRQDITDPAVVEQFAAQLGDTLHLDYLYLLTVADIRATSPTLWTSWKDALLRELYQATRRVLRRGLSNPVDLMDRVKEVQNETRQLLRAFGVPRVAVNALWQTLDNEFFLRYASDEIAVITQAIIGKQDDAFPLLVIRQRTRRGGSEVFVYTRDQDELFALITTTLDQLGLTIADARILTTRQGYTLDSYIVLEESGEPISSSERLEEIRLALQDRLSNPQPYILPHSRYTPRRLKHFPVPTEVRFSLDGAQRRTVMVLLTQDRPGLLARVGQAMVACGVRVQNAKIATVGAQADDVFFITDRSNQPLDDDRQVLLRQAILEQLDGAN